MLMVQLAPRQQRLPRVEVDRLAFVPVKEFVFRDIEMKATRQSRAREWIIEGAVLPRTSRPMPGFTPTRSISSASGSSAVAAVHSGEWWS